jgi:ATP-binding cassette subfamily C (CFTR/MRP) protein 1/ATP-binding cassette subfamily C (CFTR/MRP) protein 3
MTTLISVDAQLFAMLTTYLNMVWSGPFQITVSLIMLWKYIGSASLAGLATMAIFVPLNSLITHISKNLRKKKMKATGSRIKTTNEILNGIKVLFLLYNHVKHPHSINSCLLRKLSFAIIFHEKIYKPVISLIRST